MPFWEIAEHAEYWTCGHCGEGLMSLELNAYCTNSSCGRRRDAHAINCREDELRTRGPGASQRSHTSVSMKPDPSPMLQRWLDESPRGESSLSFILGEGDSKNAATSGLPRVNTSRPGKTAMPQRLRSILGESDSKNPTTSGPISSQGEDTSRSTNQGPSAKEGWLDQHQSPETKDVQSVMLGEGDSKNPATSGSIGSQGVNASRSMIKGPSLVQRWLDHRHSLRSKDVQSFMSKEDSSRSLTISGPINSRRVNALRSKKPDPSAIQRWLDQRQPPENKDFQSVLSEEEISKNLTVSGPTDSQKMDTSRSTKRNPSATQRWLDQRQSPENKYFQSVIPEEDDTRNLMTNHRIRPLPSDLQSLSRVIISTPNNRIWFSTKEDLSLSNRCKAFLEHSSEEPWCWWPLRPRMRLLQNDETRMHWLCHCGTHLWTEMSTYHAVLIREILEHRGTVDEHYHLCGLGSRAIGGNRYSSPSTPGNQGQHYPSTGSSRNPPTPSSGGKPADSRTQDTSTTRGSQTSQPPDTNTTINVRDTNQSIILLGVKGSRITLELAQIDTIRYGRDDIFFWTLKRQYKQCRGSLRYWLSIWKLSHCDFVKFEKIWADAIVCRGKDLPMDTMYEYDPRPPHADNPPISPHEFEAAFASCANQCTLAPFHDCFRVPGRDFALKRIPKRKWEVEMKTEEREHVWGLEAQHKISFLRVLVYHCLILSGAFGFWAWWLVEHPDDLQSAAVPATVALTLLSLFWSASGIIKGSRKFG